MGDDRNDRNVRMGWDGYVDGWDGYGDRATMVMCRCVNDGCERWVV